MATKFGIRSASRSGNAITFTVVALNADGTIDTAYAGTVAFSLSGASDPTTTTFTPGDAGMLMFSATATGSTVSITAFEQGNGQITASLIYTAPSGRNIGILNTGDDIFVGGVGDDTFTAAGGGKDLFLLQAGGADTVNGGADNDGIYFGGAFDAGDTVNAGLGNRDQVALRGDYSALTTLSGSQFTGVESFALLSALESQFEPVVVESYDYNLALIGTWAANTIFNWNGLNGAEDVTIDASGTTSGTFTFFGGFGIETLTGGAGNDGFYFGQGRYDPFADRVDGGGGTDNQIALRGNFTHIFGGTALVNIQTIALISGSDPDYLPIAPTGYNLTLSDGNVAAGQMLTITGAGLASAETMTVDGGGETSGTLRLIGGAGDDNLTGGGGDDIFWGGLGFDIMVGNGGSNTFVFTDVAESGNNFDLITGFTEADLIDLSAIDADTNMDGHQSFTFIGSNAFSGVAGQLRFEAIAGGFRIDANIDGDPGAQMSIGLLGPAGGFIPSADDFIGVV